MVTPSSQSPHQTHERLEVRIGQWIAELHGFATRFVLGGDGVHANIGQGFGLGFRQLEEARILETVTHGSSVLWWQGIGVHLERLRETGKVRETTGLLQAEFHGFTLSGHR